MSRLRLGAALLTVSALGALLASGGCGGKTTEERPKVASGQPGGKGPGMKDHREGKTGGGGEAVKPAGYATLKGKVTYDGTPPTPEPIPIPSDNKDKSYCLSDPHGLKNPTWVVGPDKGVANVVVWIKPPPRMHFDVPLDQRKPQEKVVKVDQPFCQFVPHVSIAYPAFYDSAAKKDEPTGQVFEVVNSAQITHNTNWTPTNQLLDTGANEILQSKAPPKQIQLLAKDPRKPYEEDLLNLKCNIHQWMTGYVWAFNHPYAAKTDDKGEYEIKNVPAGCEVYVAAWHEPNSYLLPEEKPSTQGEKIELKPSETKTLDLKIK